MRSSRTASTTLSWVVSTASVALAGAVLAVALHDGLTWARFLHQPIGFSLVLVATMPVLGAFVVTRHSGNRLGWVFCLIGPLRGIQLLADVWAHHAYVVSPRSWPGGSVASLLFFVGPVFVLPTAPLMALWFPDGRAPSNRWARVEIAPALVVVFLVGTLAFVWPFRGPQLLSDSPTLGGWRGTLAQACVAAAVIAAIAGSSPALPA